VKLPTKLPAPGGVLALDLSGIVGWSYIGPTDACGLRGGVWPLPKRSISAGAQGAALENEIIVAWNTWQPSLILFEAPLPVSASGTTTANVLYQQYGLAQITECAAFRLDTEVAQERPQTVRLQVMGKGNGNITTKAKQGGAIQRWLMQNYGVETIDHNAADAVLLAIHGIRKRGRRLEP
jgi:hypothetical protein